MYTIYLNRYECRQIIMEYGFKYKFVMDKLLDDSNIFELTK